MKSLRHIGTGPHGDRSTVIFKGGRFEGPELRGEILPGGGGESVTRQGVTLKLTSSADWEIIRKHDGDQ